MENVFRALDATLANKDIQIGLLHDQCVYKDAYIEELKKEVQAERDKYRSLQACLWRHHEVIKEVNHAVEVLRKNLGAYRTRGCSLTISRIIDSVVERPFNRLKVYAQDTPENR